jgi:mannose-6-phosphate isomerase-like protein (cupin superfamily)
MPFLANLSDLRPDGTGSVFEGTDFGNINLSFFFTNTDSGHGPVLHQHPYEEVFVILEGQATFTIAGQTLISGEGDVLLAPANTPHKFINSGEGRLRSINIHPSKEIIQVQVKE